MTKSAQIQFGMDITLPVRIMREGDVFVAYTPVLDLSSQGKTKAKAKKNIAEAILMFLKSCVERGTLDQVLKDCGWKLVDQQHTPKQEWPSDMSRVKIPVPFMVNDNSKHWHV